MVVENDVSKTMEKHLEAIDIQMENMIKADFNHESIHMFRESIRQFRALMFFYVHNIRSSDYRMVEFLTKKYFNMTSLIREIDVFESGYEAFMLPETMKKLENLKKPLLEKLKLELSDTNGFRFQQIKIHVKPTKTKTKTQKCISARQCDLLEIFIDKDDEKFSDENYIHSKRMLAKKLIYIHNILMPDTPELDGINEELENFQSIAKQLHDVCVNLRFVGQYQLDDAGLITKLIQDHETFVKLAEVQYGKTCEAIKNKG